MKDVSTWLPPIIVTTAVTMLGFLIRYMLGSITDKLESLEASFTRVTGDLAAQHRAMETRIDHHDRRITRLESWKEIISLPDTEGRRRRMLDRLEDEHMREDTENGT